MTYFSRHSYRFNPFSSHPENTGNSQMHDTVPERLSEEYITLTFTSEDQYIETHAIGPVTYSGEYRVRDANHLTFINQESPNNKSLPPHLSRSS